MSSASLFLNSFGLFGLLVLLLLLILGIVIIAVVAKILLFVLPAGIVAIVVWWFTKNEVLAGVAFIAIAVLSILRR